MLARTNGPEPDLVNAGFFRACVQWSLDCRKHVRLNRKPQTDDACCPPYKLLVMRPNQKAGRLLGHGAKYLSIANDAEVLQCSLGRQVTRQASSVRVLGLAVQPYSKRTV
jgi:hypothetical protein